MRNTTKPKLLNIAQIAAAAAIIETPAVEAETPVAVLETPAPDNVIPMVPVVSKTPKQAFVGCSLETKQAIQEMAKGYVGPGVTKSYPMTEKEAVDLLWHVATNNRFQSVPVIDKESGEPIFDEDGQPCYESKDEFELESKRIFALRDTKPERVDYNSRESLLAQMAKVRASLAKLGLEMLAD